jgi:SAM-dependent methyltransferase
MRSFNSRAIEDFLRREFAAMPAHTNGRLLDLGCGTRPYAKLYGELFGMSIAGDFDQRTADLDVRLDATALPFADQSFDLVLFSEVIEHVPDAAKAIAEVARVLRPGGVLLITWPFNYMIHEDPHDYVRFTEFGMDRVLRANGMTIEVTVHRGGVLMLGVALMEFLLVNAMEAIARIPLLGNVIRPIRNFAAWALFDLPYATWFWLRRSIGTNNQFQPGNRLTGWRGSLRRWTLGYCVRARKVGQ